jgi:hypothetical protein
VIDLPLTLAVDLQQLIPLVAIGGGILIAIVSIIASSTRATARIAERGRAQREIAAYVAEGSMTPEDGERLLRAGLESPKDKC